MSAKPSGVLILSNDYLTPFAKTSDYLCAALERQGIPTYVRDNYDARILNHLFSLEMDHLLSRGADAVSKTFRDLLVQENIDTILSLDLNWYCIAGQFTSDPSVKSIHSLWFDDFRSWLTSPYNIAFPASGTEFQKDVRHPKVTHHFYGASQALEAQLLGVTNQRLTRLAAPMELLKASYPVEHTHKLAFIGNPGFRGKPDPSVVARLQNGADLAELRQCARDSALKFPDVHLVQWIKEEPTVLKLMSVALEARRMFPFKPALQILKLAGEHHPRAFDYLNESGRILDASVLVKLVNRYDRPAFVYRLWSQNLVDVYSAQDEWKPYGVTALPHLKFYELPEYYQKYAAHLNAPNSIRDATANEKLFEIAASGRLSINLNSPDVRSCYLENEAWFVESLSELETRAREAIAHPDDSLAAGARARSRTAREHLWDHRIISMFR